MRASIRSIISGVVLAATTVAVTAPPAPAFAQKGDKKKLAKEYVDAGLAAQEAGDYDGAIELYQKAYALVPHPILHFNIGQAHRLAGRDEEARVAYEAYLDADPNGAKVKEAKSFLKEIEARLTVKRRQEEEAARKAAEEQARRDAEAEALRKQQEQDAAKLPPPEDEKKIIVPPPPEEPEDGGGGGGGGGWKRPTGIVVGSLGAVSLGVGVFFGLKAKSLSDELSEPGAQFDPAKEADGEAAERNMFITVGAGAALITTGIVLFVLGGGGGGGDEESSVSWTPVVGADHAGVAFSGAF